ncbi:DUF362 domain-containing protein [bacterium]|nr:DUF362 domain-containing protein [bacterium]
MSKTARVGLARQESRRENIYHAMDLVRKDLIPKLADQVMLKPNFLSNNNQLASSHADAMRGAIDFLLSCPSPPSEILIAEGGNEDRSGECFDNFGYPSLIDEYEVAIRLIDLNQETEWETCTAYLHDRSEYQVHMPKTVLDCPCTISVAIAKTHDVCCVTLALKNMIMGTLRKQDRVKMHGYTEHKTRELPTESRTMSVNLIRLSHYLKPDIGVIDGTVGLQGNGPGGTDAVDLGVAAASADVYAVDAVISKAMGFEPLELGWLYYANDLGFGVADLEHIEVLDTSIEDVVVGFKPHEKNDLQLQWQDKEADRYLQMA